MRHIDTSGDKGYPQIVFCRKDFLKVIERCWDAIGDAGLVGIDGTKLSKFCSLDDLVENFGLSCYARYSVPLLKEYGVTDLPFTKLPKDIEEARVMVYCSKLKEEQALDYFYGRVAGQIDDSEPGEDHLKMLVKGNFLFIGIEPGFVVRLDDRSTEREFLTNCLEMCRTAMQNPTLTASPLYRRFVFTNVNV